VFICYSGRGREVCCGALYSDSLLFGCAWRGAYLSDRVVLLTYSNSIVLYYKSSLSLASISSCLIMSLTRPGYMLIVSSIVAALLSPISLDRVAKSSRKSCVHRILNSLSFVMTNSFNLYIHFGVSTIVYTFLYIHFDCPYISFVYTFLYIQPCYFVYTYNISTIWRLSTPRPKLFVYNPILLCYTIVIYTTILRSYERNE